MIEVTSDSPWWFDPLVQLGAVLVGAAIAFWATSHAQREALLDQHRLELMLELSRLELDEKGFDHAARRIPLLFRKNSRPEREYAYYWVKAGKWGGKLLASAHRRRIVDAIAEQLKLEHARPHTYQARVADYERDYPDAPVPQQERKDS